MNKKIRIPKTKFAINFSYDNSTWQGSYYVGFTIRKKEFYFFTRIWYFVLRVGYGA